MRAVAPGLSAGSAAEWYVRSAKGKMSVRQGMRTRVVTQGSERAHDIIFPWCIRDRHQPADRM